MQVFPKTQLLRITPLVLLGLVFFAEATTQAGSTLVVFSAMGDTPYSAQDAETLQTQVAAINPTSEFLVHLGDIKPGKEPCEESIYAQVSTILHRSGKPVFIIPGDNEWNDCQNPEQAWTFWRRYFLHFNLQWQHAFPYVARQRNRPENFAFLRNSVLFVGINLVGGKVHDAQEWELRQQDDLEWIAAQLEGREPEISHLVIFGHTLPTVKHEPFFHGLNQQAAAFGKPVLYLHGDGHEWIHDYPFQAQNILRVQVENGGEADPVIVTIRQSDAEPFVFSQP